MRFPARIIAVLLGFLLVTSALSPVALAQMPTQSPLNQLMKTDSSVSMNISVLTQGVMMGMLSSATCIVGGIDFTTPTHQCLSYNNQTQTYSYAQNSSGGLLGVTAQGVAITFSNPVHFSDYTKYLSQNFGLVKTAHAATGIDQLAPLTNLWLAFRNLSYLLFVIIFVVVGFAVMLRAKIDPRTVMTIENQIPKLIVALILITFSYAIAGLAIDIMWVGIYLVINIFGQLDPTLHGQIASLTQAVKNDPYNWVSSLNSGPLGFLGIAQQAAGGVKDLVNNIADNVFQQAAPLKVMLFSIVGLPIVISCAIGSFFSGIGSSIAKATSDVFLLGGIVNFFAGNGSGGAGQTATGTSLGNFGACLDSGMATVLSSIIGAVTFLIFAIALLIAIARLWWALIKAYALFLIFTIFGPLAIMSGVIPGWTKTNFEYWLRHILAYTIVFPTAMGIFLLAKTLMDVYSTSNSSADLMPPLFGANLGVNGNALAFMGPLLGFAVMMMAPQALSMVQEALNAPDPKFLAGIGQALAGGAQPFTAAGSSTFKRWTREADMFHEEGALRRAFLGQQNKDNWWRRFWVGSERNGFNSKP